MHTSRPYIRKIVSNLNKVVIGKRFDYVANLKNDEYLVYFRLYEEKPWELFLRIPVDKLDSNIPGDWHYTEKNKKQEYMMDPKHCNRYIRIN